MFEISSDGGWGTAHLTKHSLRFLPSLTLSPSDPFSLSHSRQSFVPCYLLLSDIEFVLFTCWTTHKGGLVCLRRSQKVNDND